MVGFTELMSSIFNCGETQNTSLAPEKVLNIFIYGWPLYVIIIKYRCYKLLKLSVFVPPCIYILLHNVAHRFYFSLMLHCTFATLHSSLFWHYRVRDEQLVEYSNCWSESAAPAFLLVNFFKPSTDVARLWPSTAAVVHLPRNYHRSRAPAPLIDHSTNSPEQVTS